MTTKLSGAAATDVGRVRQMNEDRYLVGDGIYAVADGVGGHQAGEVAAETAVEALSERFTDRQPQGLLDAVQEANAAVWQLAQENAERRGMGTTLIVLALVENNGEDQLAIANVGDSRAYLFQRGDLLQVSEDHSLVEELVREGQLTPEEAQVHPQRSIITRALGMEPEIAVDIWTLTPYAGDRILLCSDGLTNEVSPDRIAATLRQLNDPQEAARDLVRQARAQGGNDNITVVVVDVVEDGGRAEAASKEVGRTGTAPSPSAGPPRTQTDADGGGWPPGEGRTGTGAARATTATATRARTTAGRQLPPLAPEPRPRRFTWRVGLFFVVFLAIFGVIIGSIVWYARSAYFVGVDDANQVAVFKGRPGGFLWFQPTLVDRYDVTLDQLLPANHDELRQGKEEPSRADADRYVNNLKSIAAQATSTTTTTTEPPTTTTTTTTVRPPP